MIRIVGFNRRGEVKLVDEHGRLVGCAELYLDDAHLTGVDKGDLFDVQVKVTWTPAENEPPALDPDAIDFDGVDWRELLD